jgi:hypothetical protein
MQQFIKWSISGLLDGSSVLNEQRGQGGTSKLLYDTLTSPLYLLC